MIGLTPAQAYLVRVIAEFGATEGRPPTYREAARELGCGLSAIAGMTKGARERGWMAPGPALKLLRGLPPLEERAIELTEAGRQYAEAV
jgi:hypothetical protein